MFIIILSINNVSSFLKNITDAWKILKASRRVGYKTQDLPGTCQERHVKIYRAICMFMRFYIPISHIQNAKWLYQGMERKG